MTSEARREQYARDLTKLRHDLITNDPPEGIDKGLYFEGVYSQFFSAQCGLDDPPRIPNHPLNSIAYLTREPSLHYTDWRGMVQNLMATTNWKELYGLDYEQTLALPLSEFWKMRELQEKLSKQAPTAPKKEDPQTAAERSLLRELRDLVTKKK